MKPTDWIRLSLAALALLPAATYGVYRWAPETLAKWDQQLQDRTIAPWRALAEELEQDASPALDPETVERIEVLLASDREIQLGDRRIPFWRTVVDRLSLHHLALEDDAQHRRVLESALAVEPRHMEWRRRMVKVLMRSPRPADHDAAREHLAMIVDTFPNLEMSMRLQWHVALLSEDVDGCATVLDRWTRSLGTRWLPRWQVFVTTNDQGIQPSPFLRATQYEPNGKCRVAYEHEGPDAKVSHVRWDPPARVAGALDGVRCRVSDASGQNRLITEWSRARTHEIEIDPAGHWNLDGPDDPHLTAALDFSAPAQMPLTIEMEFIARGPIPSDVQTELDSHPLREAILERWQGLRAARALESFSDAFIAPAGGR